MAKQKIQITEQDLHKLVEDAVKTYLKEERIDEFWGGMKNTMRGISNGNWQMAQNYRSGNVASEFNKYCKSADKALENMIRIVNSNEATQDYANFLTKARNYINNVNQMYSKFAIQQSGRQSANANFHKQLNGYDDDGNELYGNKSYNQKLQNSVDNLARV